MYKKPNLPVDFGFGIWFNKKEKSEYYVTPLYFHRIKKVKYIYNNFDTIKLTNNIKRSSIFRNNTDYFNPYTERYGRFFINFLNADFSTYKTAYNTFFAFYGIELLKEYSKSLILKYSYTTKEDFYKDLEKLFNGCKENILDLQNQFKECVNYTYNLKDNNDSEYTCMERFISFVLRNDLYKYSTNTQLFFNNLSGYKVELSRLSNSKPSEIRKKIKNNEISPKTSNIYVASFSIRISTFMDNYSSLIINCLVLPIKYAKRIISISSFDIFLLYFFSNSLISAFESSFSFFTLGRLVLALLIGLDNNCLLYIFLNTSAV